MSEELLDRARDGDGAAFAELVSPYQRELHVHCYRMLGSFADADDASQETLLAAWRGLGTFQSRASVRTWLHRIATNVCLNFVRATSRRPQAVAPLPAGAPAPTGTNEVTWLEPYPDVLLDALPDDAPGPDVHIEQTEAVSLAFVTALQLLSPRTRAVLVLRDVLGFSARETAETLDSTEDAVNMALSRARAGLRARVHTPANPPREVASDASTTASRLAEALAARDIDGVVALLADEIRIAMPPRPAVWDGRERAADFMAHVVFTLVPEARFVGTRANRQPAIAVYTPDGDGAWRLDGVLVMTMRAGEIAGLTRFEASVLRGFEVPRVLADDQSRVSRGDNG